MEPLLDLVKIETKCISKYFGSYCTDGLGEFPATDLRTEGLFEMNPKIENLQKV